MKRRTFLHNLPLTGAILSFFASKKSNGMSKENYVQLLRHATLVIKINNLKILIDPMLSAKDEMDPVQNCGNDIRIPIVELPISEKKLSGLLAEVDAIVVTHTHRDHWDAAAQKLINKNKPIFCQPADLEKIKAQGFNNVVSIETALNWKGISIHRTGGQHGTGEIGKKMGTVSGFVFKGNQQSIYVAGDSIWCEEVGSALNEFKPNVTILNTGAARFLIGDPITMTPDDVLKVAEELPDTKIIAVHMNTVNHCFVKRADLANVIAEHKVKSTILIPGDGEIVEF